MNKRKNISDDTKIISKRINDNTNNKVYIRFLTLFFNAALSQP